MKTLGEVLKLSIQYLQDHKIERPRRAAEALLSHLLGLNRLDLYMQFDRPMEENELASYRGMLKRRSKGEPVEYILENVDFFHCKISITPSVLIPRQETELLIDKVVSLLKNISIQDKVAWDVCSGSGCLGIALKKAFAELKVSLSDLSQDALEVAKKNSLLNKVEVELLQGDLLHPFKGRKADFILCNPPYISEEEYITLDKEVREFEPKLALIGGKEGWEYYEKLSKELPAYLNPRGRVFFEIGYNQGNKVLEIFNDPCWKTKSVEKDLAGHDRFFFLEIE